MTASDGSGCGCGASLTDMRGGYPAHEFSHVPIMAWVQYQMPVVRHNGVCEDPHSGKLFSFSEEGFEMRVIGIVMEYLNARVGTVDHVVDGVPYGEAGGSGHGCIIPYNWELYWTPLNSNLNCNTLQIPHMVFPS